MKNADPAPDHSLQTNNLLVWEDTLRTLDGFMAQLDEDDDGDGRTLVADSGAVALQMTLVRDSILVLLLASVSSLGGLNHLAHFCLLCR